MARLACNEWSGVECSDKFYLFKDWSVMLKDWIRTRSRAVKS